MTVLYKISAITEGILLLQMIDDGLEETCSLAAGDSAVVEGECQWQHASYDRLAIAGYYFVARLAGTEYGHRGW